MYTNSWDPNNGQILVSTDQGNTFTPAPLPFKVGGNMPGRGMGEVFYMQHTGLAHSEHSLLASCGRSEQ